MARSWYGFRNHTGLSKANASQRIERQSVIIARGVFSSFEVDGPPGPFHWSPAGAQLLNQSPHVDSTAKAEGRSSISGGDHSDVILDADALLDHGDGESFLGWRFHLGSTFLPDGADISTPVGAITLCGNFRYPPSETGFPPPANIAFTIVVHSFPLIFYVFPARQVGGFTHLVPYVKGEAGRFEVFVPPGTGGVNPVDVKTQAVSFQNDAMLDDIIKLLAPAEGGRPFSVPVALPPLDRLPSIPASPFSSAPPGPT